MTDSAEAQQLAEELVKMATFKTVLQDWLVNSKYNEVLTAEDILIWSYLQSPAEA